MISWLKAATALLVSLGLSWGLIDFVAFPILMEYPRIARVTERFSYTEAVLIFFFALTLWLFYLQWIRREVWTIYVYLVYSVYILLLFVVLFTKARTYQALILNPFDFLEGGFKSWAEALMNVLYFIPLGVLYGMKAERWEFIVIALLTIFGIETIQYVFYIGTFAVSDILLNFGGCWIGFTCCEGFRQHFSRGSVTGTE